MPPDGLRCRVMLGALGRRKPGGGQFHFSPSPLLTADTRAIGLNALSTLVAAVGQLGYPQERALEGLGIDPRRLHKPRGLISWSELVRAIENLERAGMTIDELRARRRTHRALARPRAPSHCRVLLALGACALRRASLGWAGDVSGVQHGPGLPRARDAADPRAPRRAAGLRCVLPHLQGHFGGHADRDRTTSGPRLGDGIGQEGELRHSLCALRARRRPLWPHRPGDPEHAPPDRNLGWARECDPSELRRSARFPVAVPAHPRRAARRRGDRAQRSRRLRQPHAGTHARLRSRVGAHGQALRRLVRAGRRDRSDRVSPGPTGRQRGGARSSRRDSASSTRAPRPSCSWRGT